MSPNQCRFTDRNGNNESNSIPGINLDYRRYWFVATLRFSARSYYLYGAGVMALTLCLAVSLLIYAVIYIRLGGISRVRKRTFYGN